MWGGWVLAGRGSGGIEPPTKQDSIIHSVPSVPLANPVHERPHRQLSKLMRRGPFAPGTLSGIGNMEPHGSLGKLSAHLFLYWSHLFRM
jgi:hypothetical protein